MTGIRGQNGERTIQDQGELQIWMGSPDEPCPTWVGDAIAGHLSETRVECDDGELKHYHAHERLFRLGKGLA